MTGAGVVGSVSTQEGETVSASLTAPTFVTLVGWGLGLAMCRRIVEAHGGRIAATNRPGRGLAVVVTFPR